MIKILSKSARGLALVGSITASTILGSGVVSARGYHGNDYGSNSSRYSTRLDELNGSGVTGRAKVTLEDEAISVTLNATGLVPDMVHPAHIHGQLTGADAMCPTDEADVNGDGIVSVFEGAPDYGPIKLNLTTPQTPFGAPANAVLFAPFAGMPDIADFPMSDGDGQITIDQTYDFDMSKQADKDAYEQLMQLDKQHIVVHGGYAPENVDTPGGSDKVVYDALLPVACGEIHVKGGNGRRTYVEVQMHHSGHRDMSNNYTGENE